MTIDTGGLQHTFDHVDCPACDYVYRRQLDGGELSAEHTFSAAAELWLETRSLSANVDRAQYVAPRTLRDDRQRIRALNKFFHAIPLSKINGGHLRIYQDQRSQTAGGDKINKEISTLKRILCCAGLWDANFKRTYKPLATKLTDVPRAMSPEEQSHFLGVAATRKKWELAYWYSLAALDTACSNCEMRGLRLADVNCYEEVLQVQARHAKNRFRVRTIPLSKSALWALDRVLQRARSLGSVNPQDYLFPFLICRNNWDTTRPMTEWGIRRDFDAIAEAAGLPWVTPHGLRHTGITRWAEAGIPIGTIMDMAGHMGPLMMKHYTHISLAAKRKAVQDSAEVHRISLRPRMVAKAAVGG